MISIVYRDVPRPGQASGATFLLFIYATIFRKYQGDSVKYRITRHPVCAGVARKGDFFN
jgi:hypothetical protein